MAGSIPHHLLQELATVHATTARSRVDLDLAPIAGTTVSSKRQHTRTAPTGDQLTVESSPSPNWLIQLLNTTTTGKIGNTIPRKQQYSHFSLFSLVLGKTLKGSVPGIRPVQTAQLGTNEPQLRQELTNSGHEWDYCAHTAGADESTSTGTTEPLIRLLNLQTPERNSTAGTKILRRYAA